MPLPIALLLCATLAPEVELVDHAALSARLRAAAAAHPDVAKVLSLGISREGRVLEALELSGRDAPGKPAVLVVANVAGPLVFGGAVALDHAERLAAGYGSDGAVTAFLDATRVYVVPRANPDAAEARFQEPLFERRAGGHGVDQDRDGRDGEDGPADVDGDGRVLAMRVPDPDGEWTEDPTDPRALVKADRAKGQRGRWRLEVEGRDADGDERAAEDPPHDAWLERTFPAGWVEHDPRSGLFPSDEPEARALLELVLAREDVALVLVYGGPSNLAGKPASVADDAPAVKRVPPAGYLASDAALLQELGRRYRAATESEAAGEGEEAGSFQRWCWEQRGIPALVAPLWEMPEKAPEPRADDPGAEEGEAADGASAGAPAEEGAAPPAEESAGTPAGEGDAEGSAIEEKGKKKKDEPEPSRDAKRLKWVDGSGEAWRFVPWTPFEHPELGPVEIGGFAPYALVEPPRAEWDELARRHLDFLLSLGDVVPRVSLAECEARELGGDLWRVRAVVANDSLLPLRTRAARRAGALRPARVALTGGELVAGPRAVRVEDLPGSGGRRETVWIVRAADPASLEVTVTTDDAGCAAARPEVVR